MRKPLVAIVGRPNVGKSSLFNRIIQRRMAIVEGEPGITRDRLYADCHWRGQTFVVIDTGGLDFEEKVMSRLISLQAKQAMEEADVILFLVDNRQGMTPQDEEIAQLLRTIGKPVLLVVNKVDNKELENHIYEFFSLGVGVPFPISAEHGRNIGDMLDAVVDLLPHERAEDTDGDEGLKIAVIGKPNVGKSSLLSDYLY